MKIALVAMSGIRACDPELLRLGLSLPGFVDRSKVIASLPSLGLLTLAGMTPDDHAMTYLEISDLKNFPVIPTDFDLVAISSYTAQIGEAYQLGDYYRKMGIPVVIGGLHASALPGEAKAHCDSVVIGEGEVSWLQVLEDCAQKRLRPFYNSNRCEFDLADSPTPAFELLDISKYNRLTIQTSRGCPLRCEFCASANLITKRYKQKPPGKVLAEIDKIQRIWKRPFIEFADDNTFVHKNYWKNLLPEIKRRHIRWFTETDISVAEDEELLALMQDSGCAEVLIGLESPVREGLDGLEMNRNWKLKQFGKYGEYIRRIQSYGIRVNGCFMIGLDGHDPDIFDQVFEAAMDLELFDVQITFPTPFPGTPFRERLLRENRLFNEKGWNYCTLFDVQYQSTGMTAEELRQGFRELGVKLYSRELTAWRRERFEETCKKYLHKKTQR